MVVVGVNVGKQVSSFRAFGPTVLPFEKGFMSHRNASMMRAVQYDLKSQRFIIPDNCAVQ